MIGEGARTEEQEKAARGRSFIFFPDFIIARQLIGEARANPYWLRGAADRAMVRGLPRFVMLCISLAGLSFVVFEFAGAVPSDHAEGPATRPGTAWVPRREQC